jgi:hypothetical protein
MKKLIDKPVGLVAGAAAGALAGIVCKQIWRLIADEDEAPDATDPERTWTEILIAAALQGAIFAIVKAAVDRAGAQGVRKLTGTLPID